MQIVSLFVKEWRHIVRDRKTLAMVLVIPILELLLFGFAINTTISNVPVAVLDEDNTVQSRALVSAFLGSGLFAAPVTVRDTQQLNDSMVAGASKTAMHIPRGFALAAGGQEPVKALVYIDGSDTALAAQVRAAAHGAGLQASNEQLRLAHAGGRAPALTETKVIFNPQLRTADFIVPGFLAIILQKACILLTAFALVRERENHTFDQLLLSQLTPFRLVVGKILPYYFLSTLVLAGGLAIMRFVFDVHMAGSYFQLLLICCLFMVAAQSLGLLISALARTHMEAMHLAYFILVPSILLSGFMWPLESLPLLFQHIAECLPVTHLIVMIRAIVLRGATLNHLLPNMAALAGMALLFALTSVVTLRRQVFGKTR